MLQYLIILLDDTSTSYCHYNNSKSKKRLISLDDLKTGILFAMKQNLTIQFVYPAYEIPKEHQEAIETIDHVKIMPASCKDGARSVSTTADVLVFNSCKDAINRVSTENDDKILVLRMCGRDAWQCVSIPDTDALPCVSTITTNRLNIIITDTETFTEKDFENYKQWLSELATTVVETYGNTSPHNGKIPQINLLTDRILLKKMNNCNAGVENITLAPNGKFYICPAFYYDDEKDDVGSLKDGLNIKNQQLYKLEYAPLCRNCDAYQCKRCVWLNKKTTLEVNTPSHEQCVAAHLERNASEKLLNELKTKGYFPDVKIPAIDYLDPFEKITNL